MPLPQADLHLSAPLYRPSVQAPKGEVNRSQYTLMNKSHGFTLIELLVVIAIVATVAAIATPSWNNMIVSNRIRAAVNDWILSTHFARSEALKRNITIILCPSSNGTSCTNTDYESGWIVTTATGTSGIILQDTLPKQRLTMVPNLSSKRRIRFLPNGLLIGNYTGVHITVRDFPASDDSLTRHICVPRTGRIRVYTDDQFMNLPGSVCGV